MPKGGKPKAQISKTSYRGTTWIDVTNPTAATIKKLSKDIKLHPLDVEDILSPAQRPKLERQKDYLFLIFRFPRTTRQGTRVRPTELDVVIAPKLIITFHGSDLSPVQSIHADAKILTNRKQELFSDGTASVLRQILQRLFEEIYVHTDAVSRELDALETHVFKRSAQRRTIDDIAQLRRKIIDYRRIAKPQSNFLKQAESAIAERVPVHSKVYWRNLVEITDGQWELLENFRETIEGLADTSDSLFNHRLNQVFRLLTVISVTFLPATFVIDLFDLDVPGAPLVNTEGGFFAVMAIVIVVELIFIGFLRRRRVL